MKKEELVEKDTKRYEVLRWIYDQYQQTGNRFVNVFELINSELDWQEKRKREDELSDISDYLAGEGLILTQSDDGSLVYLEHRGIKEVEDSIRKPEKATEHFSIPVIQNFNTFNAPVGSFQQGNENTANIQQNFGAKTEDVINLLRELQEHIIEENKQEGLDYIEGLETEIKSDKPSESRIKLYLKSLGGIIKETGKELVVEIGKKVISGEIQFPN